jgi:hypothetical protein
VHEHAVDEAALDPVVDDLGLVGGGDEDPVGVTGDRAVLDRAGDQVGHRHEVA